MVQYTPIKTCNAVHKLLLGQKSHDATNSCRKGFQQKFNITP